MTDREFDAWHMARALELAARGLGRVEPNPLVGCTIVRDGETGRIVPDDQFAEAIAGLLDDPGRLGQMRSAARAYALTASWDSVFEGIYADYETILPCGASAKRVRELRSLEGVPEGLNLIDPLPGPSTGDPQS